MKIYLFFLFQIITISVYSQKNNSISVSYFNSYLAGDQLEVKTTVYPLPFQMGINIGIALDPNNIETDYSLKGGLVYDLYRRNKLSISLGARFSVESFFNEDVNSDQLAYNYDFPIDLKYDLLPRLNLSITMIPTWNRYYYYNNNIALSSSVGLGYYF